MKAEDRTMKVRRIVALLLLGFLFTQTSYAQRVEVVAKPHSSKRASIYSAILPGMGQVYNRQIWKVPIIYALGATTTYIAIDNYRNSIKFKDEYFNRLNGNTSQLLSDYASYSDESILSLHEAYNKNFQLGIIVTGAVYLLNIVDAMVYGHLFDFNINEDLSARIQPFAFSCFGTTAPQFGMTLSIGIK